MNLEEIPQNIKDSLFSERVGEILEDVRREACITSPGLIAGAYYNLIAKETPAHYFVETLAETGIGGKIAASTAKAIKERILESERYPLFRWGIDISEIKVSDAPDIEKLGLKELEPEGEGKDIHPESVGETESESIPVVRMREVPPEVKKEETATPFILQEKLAEEKVAVGGGIKAVPSFSFGFFKTKKVPDIVSPQTIKAKVEAPVTGGKRVVHYTEARSTSMPFETGGEFLRTEELSPIIKPAEVPRAEAREIKSKPQPEPKQEETESGPSIEGNIINLKE